MEERNTDLNTLGIVSRGSSNLSLTKLKALFSLFTNPIHSPKLPVQMAQHSFTDTSQKPKNHLYTFPSNHKTNLHQTQYPSKATSGWFYYRFYRLNIPHDSHIHHHNPTSSYHQFLSRSPHQLLIRFPTLTFALHQFVLQTYKQHDLLEITNVIM